MLVNLFRLSVSKQVILQSRSFGLSCRMSAKQVDPAKAKLRVDVAQRIAKLSDEEKERQSQIVCEKIIKHPAYIQANRISIFLGTFEEVDTYPIVKDMSKKGKKTFVPQYAGGQMNMLYMKLGDANEMVKTKHGIAQHAEGAVRENAMETGGLDLVILPGAAFTKAGHRLGHGGGYYDKYLAKLFARHAEDPQNFLKPKLIAVAFNVQIYDEIPVNEHDVVLDEIITAD